MTHVINVGLIGLSADTSSGTTWAALAHLPYLMKSPKYKIVALQNSSAEKAQKAIKQWKLPASVVAYGTPGGLANDKNVELVVSCIRVDSHGQSIIPTILAHKDVFVEWPLEANFTKAQELLDLTKKHQVRNVAGLEAQFTPVVRQLKQIIESGRIGRVTSSSNFFIATYFGASGRKAVDYFADREVGGNLVTIYFAHAMEYMTEVLGQISSFNSLLSIQHPIIDIKDVDDGPVVETGRARTSHDHLLFNGHTESGALFSYQIRGGRAFPNTPCMDWRIQGTAGEIRLTSDTIHIFSYPGTMKVEIVEYATEKVEELKVWEDNLMGLSIPASNMGMVYEAFWEEKYGDTQVRNYRNFEDAKKWHKMIDEMYARYDEHA